MQLFAYIQRDYGLPVLEIGSTPSFGEISRYCGKLSILQSAEIIRRARLFIGIDSGPATSPRRRHAGRRAAGQLVALCVQRLGAARHAVDRVDDIEVEAVRNAVSQQLHRHAVAVAS